MSTTVRHVAVLAKQDAFSAAALASKPVRVAMERARSVAVPAAVKGKSPVAVVVAGAKWAHTASGGEPTQPTILAGQRVMLRTLVASAAQGEERRNAVAPAAKYPVRHVLAAK